MALGIPTVCSPVGVNSEIIEDGTNGFIANRKSEWIEKLTTLIQSYELRQRIGKKGRLTVEKQYSAEVQAPRVLEVFESAIREPKQN
ncbi:MAG TPA: glycosyltransferase, partial [Pyrinomonadaceae bacterium]|nr:glycosyltransferase [Pyrinomonadaceae bacterium]